MNREDLPQWVKNKYVRDAQYAKENIKQISIKLNKNTDAHLIKIYNTIPNKAEWLKGCLLRYEAEHPKDDGWEDNFPE